MTAAVVRMSGGRPEILKSCQADLAIDLLSGAPDLAGQEIRTRLDEAGIREKRCVVCIPLKWALTMQTPLPDLPEEDLASFVRLQAEKALPFAPQDLILAESRYQCPGEKRSATVAALPANRLATLENVLRAAGLRPVSIMFGVSTLVDETAVPNSIALLLSGSSVELEIRAGSGAAALRSLEEAIGNDAEESRFDADMIARQLRITLGNLPQSFHGAVSTIRIFGPEGLCRALAAELGEAIRPLGLSVEVPGPEGMGFAPGAGAPGQPFPWVAAPAAARRLAGRPPEFEFLPRRPTRWERTMGMFHGRGVMRMVAAAGCFVGLIVLVFAIQYVRLARLESQWQALEPKSTQMEAVQKNVRDYRTWFDTGAPSLTITTRLVSAFPEDGKVWATAVSIKNRSEVTCAGNASSDRDWQTLLTKLRNTKGIAKLQVLQVIQVKGGTPMQFQLRYTDTIGEGNGN
jgi:hypothetical protein